MCCVADRKDGLGPLGEAAPLMTYFLGPTIADKRGHDMPTDVVVRVVPYHCPEYDLPPPLMRGGRSINLAKMVSGIVGDARRNQLLLDLIQAAVRAGRKVLCLSDRRAHCSQLLQLFANACPDRQGSLYLGGMKPAAMALAAAQADVLFASYGLASEGLDIPTLDTLVLCTARSTIEQAAGRVLRGAPCPVIYDVLDRCGVCFAQFNKRKAFYSKCGFAIQFQGKEEEEEQEAGFAFLPDGDDSDY